MIRSDKTMTGVVVATSTLALSGIASAALTATESFDYTPGSNIEGQTGGAGWTGAWTVDADGTFTATAPGLSYTGLTPAGGAANIQPGSATSTYYRDLATTLTTGDTFYVGFIAEKTIANDDTAYFGVGLFQGNNEKTLIGQGSGFANWTINQVGAVYAQPGNAISSSVSSQDQSYVLARIDLRAGVETMTFWVNPDFSKSEMENTPVGSFVSNVDWGSVNRIRVGGGGTGARPASAHLLDEIRVSTSTPFAPGNTRLFYDDGEDVTAGSAALPLFGTYSPKPYPQQVLAVGPGATTPSGKPLPATAPGDGPNLMVIDRAATNSLGRRNYGEFVTAATGEGTVRMEGDFYLGQGQLQVGLGSNEGGVSSDSINISLGLNINADGSVRSYATNQTIAGLAFTLGEWENLVIEYELGASVFSVTLNGVTAEVPLPTTATVAGGVVYVDPAEGVFTSMHRVWLAGGTSSTAAFYDNLDVQLIVPEPASMALIAMGGLAMLTRRRASNH